VTVAALELGGSHVAAGFVDLDAGAVTQRRRLALDSQASRGELLGRIRDAAAAAAGAGRLGVAAPGPFDYELGVAWMRHKLPALYGVDLRGELADSLGVEPETISFLNDADAFLLGEWLTGAARGVERVIGMTLGTGLGSAFLASGALVMPGELYRLSFRGRPVEQTISAGAIADAYDAAVPVAEVAARARDGDTRARGAFERVGVDLGEFLLPHVERFGADRVVVGGAIALAWDLFGPALRAQVTGAVRAANVEDAVLVGAAYYAG
jgi:glucokinase